MRRAAPRPLVGISDVGVEIERLEIPVGIVVDHEREELRRCAEDVGTRSVGAPAKFGADPEPGINLFAGSRIGGPS